MSNFIATTLIGANTDVTITGTTTDGAGAPYALGTKTSGIDGTEWLFVQAAEAIDQYNYVCVDENEQARKGTKVNVDAGHTVAFAPVALADNEFGWVALQNRGSVLKVRVLGSCAADVALYTSSTAGVLDDDSSSQTAVGVTLTASNATSATTSLNFISAYARGR